MALVTGSDTAVPVGFFATAKMAVRQFGLVGAAGRYLLLRDELQRFVRRGKSSAERARRRALLERFSAIHASVPCAHSPAQFTIMADYLLELDVPGDIVQCGAYKGGSTAKLSLVLMQLHDTGATSSPGELARWLKLLVQERARMLRGATAADAVAG